MSEKFQFSMLNYSQDQINSIPDEYAYQPLDPLVDTMRLIELKPSDSFDAPVYCRLNHVEFGQKPKYNALSYTWGDEDVKETIYVDGKWLDVGENLFKALSCLRNRSETLPLWADAICINQKDISERNRQLRIMPHIYTRAKTVLIWLGRRSASCQGESWQRWTEESRATQEWGAWKDQIKPIKPSLHYELGSDCYWERVWIIQEIGKARSIQVCFDEHSISWSDFIRDLKWTSAWEDCGPLKIDRQLQEKYQNSHTLVYLLQTYENSKCKDLRDKIYGFIGLAIDCYGFPMDYSKSTYEVWEDTMAFLSWHDLVEPSSVVEFGKLVKRLLGYEQTAPIKPTTSRSDSPLCAPSPPEATDPFENGLVKISAVVVGVIIHIGPPPEKLVSELRAVDEWEASIYKNFSSILGNASEENDMFIQALEGLDQADLEKIIGFDKEFHDPLAKKRAYAEFLDTYHRIFEEHRLGNSGSSSATTSSRKNPAPSDYQLFQHKSIKQGSGIMGICPKQACQGDLVCRLHHLDRAVVVRKMTNYRWGNEYRVIGTAILSIDLVNIREKIPYTGTDTFNELLLAMEAKGVYILAS
jgi:hypothetical protein